MFRSHDNLIPHLPYWYLDPRGVMLLPNGQVEVGVEFFLGPDHLRSEPHRQRILSGFKSIVENYTYLPNEGRIRFIVEARPADPRDINEYLSTKTDPNPVLQFFARHYAEVERRRALAGERTSWRYYITMRLGVPRVRYGGSTLAALFGMARQALGVGAKAAEFWPMTADEYEKLITHALDTAQRLASHLSAMGAWAKVLDADEIHNIVLRFWNGKNVAYETYEPSHDFHTAEEIKRKKLDPLSYRKMVARSEVINVARDYLYVGDRTIRIYELEEPPLSVFWNFLDVILPPYPHYAVLDVRPPSPMALQYLQNRKRQAARFNAGADRGSMEMSAESLAEAFEEFFRIIEGEGGRALLFGLALAMDEPENPYYADALESELIGRAKNAGVPLRRVREFLFTPYLRMAPFSGGVYPLSFDVTSLHTAYLFTHNPAYRSTQNDLPHHLFPTRHNTWAKVTPFAHDLTNFNGVILGSSGSGKTFSALHMLTDLLGDENVRVIVVDKKGDYIPLLEAVGGQIVEISPTPKVPTSINMFDLDGPYLSGAKQAFLDQIFLIMADYPENHPDKAIAEALWRTAYSRAYGITDITSDKQPVKQIPTLPRVISIMENISNIIGREGNIEQIRVARDAATRLRKWVEGPLANLISKESTVDIRNSKFIYFDLRGLDQLGDDRATALAIALIANTIYNALENWPRSLRKVIVFDEARAAFKIPAAAELITDLYRRARSYGGSVWTMTQAISDFFSGHTDGLLNSATQYYIFSLSTADDVRMVVEKLGLPSESQPVLESIHRQKGQYAEAFWYIRTEAGSRGEVIRIVPTPVAYWLFTSDATEQARREEAVRRHNGDIIAAIAELSGLNVRQTKEAIEALARKGGESNDAALREKEGRP